MKDLSVSQRGKITAFAAPFRNGSRDPIDQLPHTPLASRGSDLSMKVLRDNDIGCGLGPTPGNFDVFLLKYDFAFFTADGSGPRLPFNGIIGRHPVSGEKPGKLKTSNVLLYVFYRFYRRLRRSVVLHRDHLVAAAHRFPLIFLKYHFLLSESRLHPASLSGADFTGFMLTAVQRQTCLRSLARHNQHDPFSASASRLEKESKIS